MFTRVVNLLTFEWLFSRVRRGKERTPPTFSSSAVPFQIHRQQYSRRAEGMTHWSRESHPQLLEVISVVCNKLHCFAPVCTNFLHADTLTVDTKRDEKGRSKR